MLVQTSILSVGSRSISCIIPILICFPFSGKSTQEALDDDDEEEEEEEDDDHDDNEESDSHDEEEEDVEMDMTFGGGTPAAANAGAAEATEGSRNDNGDRRNSPGAEGAANNS